MGPGGIFEALLQVIREPTANLTAAALIVAVAALVVLIAIVGLLLWATGGGRRRIAGRRTPPRAPAPAARSRIAKTVSGRSRLIMVALATSLGLAALISTHVIAGSGQYCADSCHHGDRVLASIGTPPHGALRCVDCHEDPAPAAAPGYTILRIGHALRGLTPAGPSYAVPSPTRACAACHGDSLTGVIESVDRGVRMSHPQPLERGVSCHECHPGIGHGQPAAVPMSRCLPCHDDETAPGRCGTCHIGEPGAAAGADVPTRVFRRVRLGPVEDCGGCHDQRSCDACHGIRMPHTTAFKEGGHARDAAFSRKQKCWRCHNEQPDCRRCHGAFTAHGDDFAREHQRFGWDSPCTGCHKGHEGSFCARCH